MKTTEHSRTLAGATGSAGSERNILVTVYAYDHESEAARADVGHVMRDLRCSFFAPCELIQRHFVIGTDAYATDRECIERFVAALKEAGMTIERWESPSLPNK
jgi:heterodisulfide reductase subunit B